MKTKQGNGDGTCIHSVACSWRSDSSARCSDGGERVKSYAEETRAQWGVSTVFFFLVNFSTALYYLNAWKRVFIPWLGQYSGVRLSTQCMSMMRVRFLSCVMRLLVVLFPGCVS